MAERAGFVKESAYPAYLYFLNPVNHYVVPGNLLMRGRKCRDAIERYEAAMAMGDVSNEVYYQAARAYAMLDETNKAIAYLNTAIDKGWSDCNAIRTCEEFQTLHDAPEWQVILDRMQAMPQRR